MSLNLGVGGKAAPELSSSGVEVEPEAKVVPHFEDPKGIGPLALHNRYMYFSAIKIGDKFELWDNHDDHDTPFAYAGKLTNAPLKWEECTKNPIQINGFQNTVAIDMRPSRNLLLGMLHEMLKGLNYEVATGTDYWHKNHIEGEVANWLQLNHVGVCIHVGNYFYRFGEIDLEIGQSLWYAYDTTNLYFCRNKQGLAAPVVAPIPRNWSYKTRQIGSNDMKSAIKTFCLINMRSKTTRNLCWLPPELLCMIFSWLNEIFWGPKMIANEEILNVFSQVW